MVVPQTLYALVRDNLETLYGAIGTRARSTSKNPRVAIEKKRALSDVAVGNAAHAGGLTRDDLLALLQ